MRKRIGLKFEKQFETSENNSQSLKNKNINANANMNANSQGIEKTSKNAYFGTATATNDLSLKEQALKNQYVEYQKKVALFREQIQILRDEKVKFAKNTNLRSSMNIKVKDSRYYNKTSPNQIRGKNKYFNKIKEEKKISHSFSEIFLKKNYPKASDFINEISNSIEKKYLLEKGKETIKINKDSTTQTNLQIKNLKGSKNKKKRHKYSKQHINNTLRSFIYS